MSSQRCATKGKGPEMYTVKDTDLICSHNPYKEVE